MFVVAQPVHEGAPLALVAKWALNKHCSQARNHNVRKVVMQALLDQLCLQKLQRFGEVTLGRFVFVLIINCDKILALKYNQAQSNTVKYHSLGA